MNYQKLIILVIIKTRDPTLDNVYRLQDAQLTHMLEILQTHTKHISNRLESFNDGLVSSINRYDHSIHDATLRIETVVLQLKNALKKSPFFSQESSSKL